MKRLHGAARRGVWLWLALASLSLAGLARAGGEQPAVDPFDRATGSQNETTGAATGSLAGAPLGGFGASAAAETHTIGGRVTLRESGQPLAEVAISTGGRTTRTNSQGFYTLGGLSPGVYTLTAARAGYQFAPASRTIKVPPNATQQHFIAEPVNYTLAGRVLEADGRPIPNAILSAGNRNAQTDAQGRFVIDNLPAGEYQVTAAREGYTFVPQSRAVALPPDAAEVDFVGLPVTYAVLGSVRDAQGRPVAGVAIRSDRGHAAVSDADGNYELNGLLPGNYELTATGLGRGYYPAVRRVTVPPNVIAQNFQALEPGAYDSSPAFLPLIRR